MPITLRKDNSGRDVTSLPIAVNKRVKAYGSDEWKEVVLYLDVSVFGKTARIASERLIVGSEVVIEGHHQNRDIVVGDKTFTTVSMIADNVHWTKATTRKEEA